MSRKLATVESERRVAHLVALLFRGVGDGGETIADVARRSGLGHETVRCLWRNAGDKKRTSPAFFVVAAIARARGLSLDQLAEQTLGSIREDQL
jgi:hypothetical protein